MRRYQGLPPTGSISISPNGTASSDGLYDSNAKLDGAYWPLGSTNVTPGMQLGGTAGATAQNGFVTEGNTWLAYAGGRQTLWANLAWTFTLNEYDRGAIVNVASTYPGTLKAKPTYRYQNYGIDGDFRTDTEFDQTIISSAQYHFNGDVSTASPTVTNLVFQPATDKINYTGTTVWQHSNSGADINDGETILSCTTTKFTMAHNALASRADADFSITVIAPAGNSSLGTFYSYVHIPFVGTLTSGSPDITNLKFNPTRIGVPPYSTLTETTNSGADIPQSGTARVIKYTQNTLTMGDATTGQPINAINNLVGASFSIDTKNATITLTGDLTAGSPIITNLSADLSAQSIPTGAASKRPQWTSTNAFSTTATVASVTSASITFTSNALVTQSAVSISAQCSKVAIDVFTMGFGTEANYFGWGWRNTISKQAFQFSGKQDVYFGTTKIIDSTTAAYVGPVNTPELTFQTPAGGRGETLDYVPVEYGSNNLVLYSTDLTNGAWTHTSISSVVLSSRVAPFADQSQYTVTSSGVGGNLQQAITVAADTTTYVLSAYFDTTSAAQFYTVQISIAGVGSSETQYNTATGTTGTSGNGGGIEEGPTLADGSQRWRVWTALTNAAGTALTIHIYANGQPGAASSCDIACVQLEALGANSPIGPTSYLPTTASARTKSAGKISPFFIPPLPNYKVAELPTAASNTGKQAYVTDGDAGLAWGATAVNTGAGATPYLVWSNGTNWTVVGK